MSPKALDPRKTPEGMAERAALRHAQNPRPYNKEFRRFPNSSASSLVSQGPIMELPADWHEWPEMTFKVFELKPETTTLDVWKRFEQEGRVVHIELFESRSGARLGTARVRFQPPPASAFWLGEVIMPTPRDEGEYRIFVQALGKKRDFMIQSPVRTQVSYPEQMKLIPISLDFGRMFAEVSMMRHFTAFTSPGNEISFMVDLHRKSFVTKFQVEFYDPDGQSDFDLDRVNRYMFTIPFGQIQQIQRVSINNTHWALLVSLDSPPSFFRKPENPAVGHTINKPSWNEMESWYRQTDIVYDPRTLKRAVVTLNKEIPVIDIGRWTTYRFVFQKTHTEVDLFETMRNALQDWNIEVNESRNMDIVPARHSSPSVWSLIDPPNSESLDLDLRSLASNTVSLRLPFDVRYQLEVCISQGYFNEHNVTREFVETLANLAVSDSKKAQSILEYFASEEKHVYNLMSIFKDPSALAFSPRTSIPHYCAYARKATVTPTMIYFNSPTVETSNRVIRHFSTHGDRFLRVQFTDEKFEGRINSCADKTRNDEIFTRVYRTLYNGIRIGDRHYQFLAFGNSQFRENGAYFFCESDTLSCDDIRRWMGSFDHISVVAKYAARLGMCFSTTRAIRSSIVHAVPIEDVERNDFCFTDGVGKISTLLAQLIADEIILDAKNVPSAFQFRMGGCKGLLVVSPEVKGQQVQIRKSQQKFTAIYNGLEIIRWSRYSVATLNRQTITILSSIGVADGVFKRMLTEQLSNYELAMTDRDLCLELLGRYIDENNMTPIIAAMVANGFMAAEEPFLMSLLYLWRSWSIKLLKEKAKIIVEQGAFLFGCTDETGTLQGYTKPEDPSRKPEIEELPQIFIQIPDKNADERQGKYTVIEGVCLVGRNPSLHPGDIRVVNAVDVPALHHLRDVVVFSQHGDRDVPSMCSGGDLDGDDFFVIWDKELLPREWNVEPMNYANSQPEGLDRPVETQDLMKFFVRYMKNDALPTIAHAHLALSDLLAEGAKDPKCLKLAALHSKAVDYVKSGVSAVMPKHLMPRVWPHFMEKKHKPKSSLYNSEKILGQLYDKVERIDFVPQYNFPFDTRILKAYTKDNATLKNARLAKSQYDAAMRRIMAQQEIQTEFEVWSTFILSKPRVGSDYKYQEQMGEITSALKDRFRRVCIEYAGSKDFKDLAPFVAAMYRVTSEEMQLALHECGQTKVVGGIDVPLRKMEPKSMPLISFPWLFPEMLGKIATGVGACDHFEELSMARPPNNIEGKQGRRKISKEQLDRLDFVETPEGVTHHGEVLDLFRPDAVDSDGDEIEVPHELFLVPLQRQSSSTVLPPPVSFHPDTTTPPPPYCSISFEDEVSDVEMDGFLDVDNDALPTEEPEFSQSPRAPEISPVVDNHLDQSLSLLDLSELDDFALPAPMLRLRVETSRHHLNHPNNGDSAFSSGDDRIFTPITSTENSPDGEVGNGSDSDVYNEEDFRIVAESSANRPAALTITEPRGEGSNDHRALPSERVDHGLHELAEEDESDGVPLLEEVILNVSGESAIEKLGRLVGP